MKDIVKKILIFIYRILNVILPKSRTTAVFSTSNGKSAGGNPRAIFEYAAGSPDAGGKYRFIWFLTDEFMRKHPEEAEKLKYGAEDPKETEKQENGTGNSTGTKNSEENINSNTSCNTGKRTARCKVVKYGHPAYYWYMARAGIWVFDSRQEPYIKKRSGVKYLQTWHGTPLKKLGLDIDTMNMAGESKDIEAYREAFRKEAAQWDWLISQNPFSSETFRRCFAFKGTMLETGYPRNDCLVRAVTRKAGDSDSRITLLYAPTWRDDRYIGGGWYAYSSPLDLNRLHDLIGDRFRIMIKPHYLVRIRKWDIPKELVKSGFVTVCGHSDEINGLYLKADAMITDYSSTMFDYSLLGRPMIFYAYDIEEYAGQLRGFYFDFEKEAPGPVCRSTEELAQAIEEAFPAGIGGISPAPEWNEKYAERIARFTGKYNTFDDGNAYRKVWEAIN